MGFIANGLGVEACGQWKITVAGLLGCDVSPCLRTREQIRKLGLFLCLFTKPRPVKVYEAESRSNSTQPTPFLYQKVVLPVQRIYISKDKGKNDLQPYTQNKCSKQQLGVLAMSPLPLQPLGVYLCINFRGLFLAS